MILASMHLGLYACIAHVLGWELLVLWDSGCHLVCVFERVLCPGLGYFDLYLPMQLSTQLVSIPACLPLSVAIDLFVLVEVLCTSCLYLASLLTRTPS